MEIQIQFLLCQVTLIAKIQGRAWGLGTREDLKQHGNVVPVTARSLLLNQCMGEAQSTRKGPFPVFLHEAEKLFRQSELGAACMEWDEVLRDQPHRTVDLAFDGAPPDGRVGDAGNLLWSIALEVHEVAGLRLDPVTISNTAGVKERQVG